MVHSNTYHPDASFRERWEALLYKFQDKICGTLEEVDGGSFREDLWTRQPAGSDGSERGGGGRSRVIQDSAVFEKAGVNVSVVHGALPEAAVPLMTSRGHSIPELSEGQHYEFYAAGLSLVLHPHNPLAPTVHLNYRMFQIFLVDTEEHAAEDAEETKGDERHRVSRTTDALPSDLQSKEKKTSVLWWFGGGTDLSPSYVFEEDCVFFHEKLKAQCDRCDERYYSRFKRWCDAYFRNHHRNEGRGIGGIFFDDLNENMEVDPEKFFGLVQDGFRTFLEAYVPILERRKSAIYSEEEKKWQQVRRGRYVEFNLVHDRGTKFGLQMPGSRIESILMSLPLTARWEYDFQVREGSREEEALNVFIRPKDWIPVNQAALEGFFWPKEQGAGA
ncbi:coproporphyrinogen iii oxidase [Cystoisospora suis]|uniref:coproporphyrinogen oxidase n=1 Tax=Cystoisospora suis TaxID=483139 RepID=A0A2C6L0I6_9APIC|nr:coproporphyrinogen iii oxidase [Cystoisospora suis]